MASTALLIVFWVVAISLFAGCILAKIYAPDLYWLAILLTCLGMFVMTISICLFIYFITGKPQLGEVKVEEENKQENNDDNNQDQGEPYTLG